MNANSLYSSIAKSYDAILSLSGYQLAVNRFVKQLPIAASESITVLDAGCGTGMYSLAILKRFPNARIAAFDLNEDMVETFRSKLAKKEELGRRINLFIGDVCSPIENVNDGFDLVVTAGVLEYVEMEKAVRNLSGHLATGGYFLNVSVKDNVAGKLVGNIYGLEPYSPERKIEAFTKSGFDLVKVMQFPLTREAYLFKKTG